MPSPRNGPDEAIRRHLWKGQLLDDLRRRRYALEWGANGNGRARKHIALLEEEIGRREIDYVAALPSISFEPPSAPRPIDVPAAQAGERRLPEPVPVGAGLAAPLPALVPVRGRAS